MDCLSKFNPGKLYVEYRDDITPFKPIIPRCYTLTHSDTTGDLFLTIGSGIALDKINSMRDEVVGEWRLKDNSLYYYVHLYIDQGEYDLVTAKKRNEIFRRELPLALTAIRYGDRSLFHIYPSLDDASVIVHFISANPSLARQEIWGIFRDYSLF
ncbi:staygreen family protein [Bacillus andreraoultii]|uniref:staygreen family protein n=1 Tax=Bacillus andreraoultii TaxID=1499685 RepID=UPI002DDABB8B|nr:staygreen family protein [Bacillus andreraoultii]